MKLLREFIILTGWVLAIWGAIDNNIEAVVVGYGIVVVSTLGRIEDKIEERR